MKLETDNDFKPFKLVVETQKEADYLYALIAGTTVEVDEILDYDSWELYQSLKEHASDPDSLGELLEVTVQEKE